MSVLKNKRRISSQEFEHTFSELYLYSMNQTNAVAKRRKKWICRNIDNAMNVIANTISEINFGYFPKETKRQSIEELAWQSIDCLANLEKPIMVFWNVEKYEVRKMANWVSQINFEMELLNGICSKKKEIRKVMILDWNKINSVVFLKNMSDLHRYIHGKVVNAKNKYDDTEASMLIDLADEAFYSLMMANSKIPTTKAQYEKRKERISTAISCLRKMNRPTLFYFNLMGYSENVMREWAGMLSKELKLLYALQKSDKERYKSLV